MELMLRHISQSRDNSHIEIVIKDRRFKEKFTFPNAEFDSINYEIGIIEVYRKRKRNVIRALADYYCLCVINKSKKLLNWQFNDWSQRINVAQPDFHYLTNIAPCFKAELIRRGISFTDE